MILSTASSHYYNEPGTRNDSFFISIEDFRHIWAHPTLLGNITGKCAGNDRVCAFLEVNRHGIVYAAPMSTMMLGLDCIASGERFPYFSRIKTSLRTAMILSHMAAQAVDPFLLSDEEKAVLLRARTGDVPPEERVELYRRTVSPENINRLLKMPDHPTIKNELFRLIEEEVKTM